MALGFSEKGGKGLEFHALRVAEVARSTMHVMKNIEEDFRDGPALVHISGALADVENVRRDLNLMERELEAAAKYVRRRR